MRGLPIQKFSPSGTDAKLVAPIPCAKQNRTYMPLANDETPIEPRGGFAPIG